jgi:hypothetical protein
MPEEIELSEEQEDALDTAWAKLDKGGQTKQTAPLQLSRVGNSLVELMWSDAGGT